MRIELGFVRLERLVEWLGIYVVMPFAVLALLYGFGCLIYVGVQLVEGFHG